MESLTPPELPQSVSRRRVLVGVAERVEQISSSSSSSSISASSSSTDLYDARIMHRAVPAHLERLTVRMNASPSDLSSTFGVPLAYVSANWLHTDTPLPNSSDINSNSTTSIRLRRPVPVSSSTRREYAELAAELAQRLSALTAPEPVQKTSYYGTEPISHQKRTMQCGFGPVPAGVRSESSRTGQALIRGKGGLYRGARALAGVTRGESSYTEVYVGYSGGAGGVCVGVMASEKERVVQEVMKLPGADGKSVAFHSSAKSVTTADTWEDYGMPYGTGDTVGVKINVTPDGNVFVEMFVNGTSCGKLENGVETLQEAIREGKSLHVAVALYRPGSRAEIRCCPQCWMYGTDGEIASCQLPGTKVGSRVSAEKDVGTVSADKDFSSSLAKEDAKRKLRALGKNAVATQIEGKVREATCTSVLTP